MARTDNPDPNAVEAICAGHRPDRRPNYATRVAACRQLAAAGYSDSQIGWLLLIEARSVVRMRRDRNIPGQPKGLNGYTRTHRTPIPVKRRTRPS